MSPPLDPGSYTSILKHLFTKIIETKFLPCLLLQLLLFASTEDFTTPSLFCWLTGMGAVLVMVVMVGAEGNIKVDMSTGPRIELPKQKKYYFSKVFKNTLFRFIWKCFMLFKLNIYEIRVLLDISFYFFLVSNSV